MADIQYVSKKHKEVDCTQVAKELGKTSVWKW